MNQLSNAETALLGLLSEKPMHPYLIEQQVQWRDMRFWTDLSMSSIYKLLRKLENDGFIARKNQISEENRLQKVYSLSKKGMSALKRAIEDKLSTLEHTRWPLDIGLYNSNLLPTEKICAALIKYRNGLQEKVKGYKDLHAFLKSEQCPEHRFHVALRPVFLLEAEVKWVDAYLHELATKKEPGENGIVR